LGGSQARREQHGRRGGEGSCGGGECEKVLRFGLRVGVDVGVGVSLSVGVGAAFVFCVSVGRRRGQARKAGRRAGERGGTCGGDDGSGGRDRRLKEFGEVEAAGAEEDVEGVLYTRQGKAKRVLEAFAGEDGLLEECKSGVGNVQAGDGGDKG
jgi:hypothetical protein